ncbi:hypothetical protein B2J88_33880 [Rhodococcus sp. SRB_17]|uniref:integrase n=1 Tax=Acidovorax sp. SRB_24 TaxID=1962700 RepID=UPI00197C3465|nr:integrase [Acidovorax sp. SRB_24]NMM89276.1 hypothetical protein [Rhodococcus sp. SRB_17]
MSSQHAITTHTRHGVKDAMAALRAAGHQGKMLSKDDRFTFHDLRAYCATMHKQAHGHLPDLHKNAAVTAMVYDRNKEVEREAL